MKSVAIITYKDAPNLAKGEDEPLKYFEQKNIHAEPLAWDAAADWSRFNSLIIRSPWDYHTRIPEFIRWCKMLKEKKIEVWNPVEIVLWNLEKTYLKALQAQGAYIIPTQWYNNGSQLNLEKIFDETGYDEIIIKPVIGASAHGVLLANRDNIAQTQTEAAGLFAASALMVQPFIKEIQTTGEISLVFIGGEYSHAAVKFPKPGHHIGIYDDTVRLIEPERLVIEDAKRILEMVKSPLLYARVDGMIVEGKFMLNELELIEPYLFFDLYPKGAEKFVETFCNFKGGKY